VIAVAPTGAANEVLYRHGSTSEFYRNGPYGLEQGFTVRQRPRAGTGSLVLALRIAGSLIPKQAGPQVVFTQNVGITALRYGQLNAVDANGRSLLAHMQLHDATLELRINDRQARYPVRVDPFIQQGEKLTGGGEINVLEGRYGGQFGASVALSADGNTALIGGSYDNRGIGAAWVFTRSGATWTQQGSKLTASDEIGEGSFGESVALSSDGNTALIGARSDHESVGAAWVFVRSGTTWSQQGSKLTATGEVGNGSFGWSVALSSDGNTALISGPYDNAAGAVWQFARSGSTWTQAGSKLTPSDPVAGSTFGGSVALSSDGSTALIGGATAFAETVGAAWVFTRSGATFTQQGPRLTARDEVGNGRFGSSVALSSDGSTAFVGGPSDNQPNPCCQGPGAAWVFTRSGSTWAQQGSKLTRGEFAEFGVSVGLSGDGNTALAGAPHEMRIGAGWAFTRSGSSWSQFGPPLVGSGAGDTHMGVAQMGSSVALASDGKTALIASPYDSYAGSVWPFTRLPPSPPTAVTGSPSLVEQTTATLSATVNPNGESVTDCHFEYGLTSSYGTRVSCGSLPGSGVSAVSVSSAATALRANVTYHVRIAATNATGTGYGADQTFKTLPPRPPEFGRCRKVPGEKQGNNTVYHGMYTAPTCLVKSETNSGPYEWDSGVVKAGFATHLKEGVGTFETVAKVKVTCITELGTGQISGAHHVVGVTVRLTGCESATHKCTTPGLAEGELETKGLEGAIGWENKALKKIALDLYPVGKAGPFMEYRCVGGVPTTITGSLLVPVTVDKMLVTRTVKYAETTGKQKPERFEGEPVDVLTASLNGEAFEQLGEKATLTQTNEEAVEINAVV
jgi:hypothetical protein